MTDPRFKPTRWDHPNKMHIDSEFVTFNKQCEYIGRGNVYGTCVKSSYIRPWNELKNYSVELSPGEALKYDLSQFYQYFNEKIRKILWDKERKDSVILYQIRVWINCHEEVIGFVLTDKDYHLLAEQLFMRYDGRSVRKRQSVMEEVKNYVVAGYWESHKEDAA